MPTDTCTVDPTPVSTITYQGEEFSTASMRLFPTRQSCLPFVYLTKDGIFFLQTHRAQWETPRVRRIPRHEANRIANLYQVEDLKHALLSPADVSEAPAATPSVTAATTDAELIKQINELTPEQLDKLAGVLQAAGLK